METREVTVHRVVNIVERRSPGPRQVIDYDRGHHDDQWYGGRRIYHDARDYHGESSYPPSDRYFDENPNYGSFRRISPPPRNEDLYHKQCYSRDDLRHQLGSRNSGRTGPYFRNRGRGSGPPRREDHYRSSPPVVSKRDRSPVRRDAQPPARSGSNTSNRSFSPDADKGYAHQQAQRKYKPGVLTSHTPSSSVEGSPHSSASSKEKTSASIAETEEVVAASMEPKLTPEDFKAYRLEAIKAKALEIEEHYRQDCETFRTVVKMLVAKEPSLDKLLQAPLDENLLETKQRCLDALRQFVKELDETINRSADGADHGSPHTSSTNHAETEVNFPQPCSTTPTITDGKQGGGKKPIKTEDFVSDPDENQGEGRKQTWNTGTSTPVPEIYSHGPEDGHSELIKLSESPASPAQQDPVGDLPTRLQLYNQEGEKFSNAHLSDPKTWKDIAYTRPGWIPNHLPYLQPDNRYSELKANSTVVFTRTPLEPKGKGPKKVGCGVTFYDHVEGPWCEVQSENGTRICILAAPPQHTPLLTAQMMRQGPPEHITREGVKRGCGGKNPEMGQVSSGSVPNFKYTSVLKINQLSQKSSNIKKGFLINKQVQ